MPTLRGRRPPNTAARRDVDARRSAGSRAPGRRSPSRGRRAGAPAARCSCRSRTPDLPAVARTAFASEPGLRGSARNEPVPISSRWAGMSDATTGDPARSASITGRDSPSSNDGTTTTLASARRASISSSLIRSAVRASPGRIAAAIDQWCTRSPVPAIPITTTSRVSSPAVAARRRRARRRCSCAASSPVITTIGPVAAPAGRGAPAGSTSRGHATWDTRASEPTAGRPSSVPSSASHHVRDAHELVVEPKGVQCRRVLGTGRDVAQVDRRVVHRDEVEDHGELGARCCAGSAPAARALAVIGEGCTSTP